MPLPKLPFTGRNMVFLASDSLQKELDFVRPAIDIPKTEFMRIAAWNLLQRIEHGWFKCRICGKETDKNWKKWRRGVCVKCCKTTEVAFDYKDTATYQKRKEKKKYLEDSRL